MRETFRQSMGWLHTWAGVVVGALLFAMFWMGTLTVFDKEIDRWMLPETRLQAPAKVSIEPAVSTARDLAPESAFLAFQLPTVREPLVEIVYENEDGVSITRHLNPVSGRILPLPESLAGTHFILPFHYSLHLQWLNIGLWLMGLAAMAMLMLLISGVVIHRKIFADFFTFRHECKLPRSSLDLHNLTGVLGLPFYFVITLSGLMISFTTYFPGLITAVYDNDRAAFFADAFGSFQREAAKTPETPSALAQLDDMLAQASQSWEGDAPYSVRVHHLGDASATVEMLRSRAGSIDVNVDRVYFDAATGDLLRTHTAAPVLHVQRFIFGLHYIQFNHWPLRWLYFVLGLSGCVVIATGFLYWLAKRRKRWQAGDVPGFRLVEGLAIGSVTGIVIATLTFFVANRLLPPGASFAGYERAALEVWAFYLVWHASFAHAWLRPGRAWREQCWAIAALALLAPVLNGVTTGDHLLKTLLEGYWPVAGMDLLLLAGAGVAIYAARKLSRSPVAINEVERPKRAEVIDVG